MVSRTSLRSVSSNSSKFSADSHRRRAPRAPPDGSRLKLPRGYLRDAKYASAACRLDRKFRSLPQLGQVNVTNGSLSPIIRAAVLILCNCFWRTQRKTARNPSLVAIYHSCARQIRARYRKRTPFRKLITEACESRGRHLPRHDTDCETRLFGTPQTAARSRHRHIRGTHALAHRRWSTTRHRPLPRHARTLRARPRATPRQSALRVGRNDAVCHGSRQIQAIACTRERHIEQPLGFRGRARRLHRLRIDSPQSPPTPHL